MEGETPLSSPLIRYNLADFLEAQTIHYQLAGTGGRTVGGKEGRKTRHGGMLAVVEGGGTGPATDTATLPARKESEWPESSQLSPPAQLCQPPTERITGGFHFTI